MTKGSVAGAATVARLESVTKVYETAAARVTALENMSWEVGRGEAVALMGPSGCGKTTVLNLLGGMDRPTSGAIWVDGADIAALFGLGGPAPAGPAPWRIEKYVGLHQAGSQNYPGYVPPSSVPASSPSASGGGAAPVQNSMLKGSPEL